MAGLVDKRKRSREDDVFCESTAPLSKRINNLHLTNFEDTKNIEHAQLDHNMLATGEMHSPHKHQTPAMDFAVEQLTAHYNPELSESENPFYYLKNKLLHELHLERLKRCIL